MAEFAIIESDTGLEVAGGSGADQEQVWREALRYFSVYSEDGPCELRFSTSELIRPDPAPTDDEI